MSARERDPEHALPRAVRPGVCPGVIWRDHPDGDRRLSAACPTGEHLGWKVGGTATIPHRSWLSVLAPSERSRAEAYLDDPTPSRGEIDLRLAEAPGPPRWMRLVDVGPGEDGGRVLMARNATREHQLATALELWAASPEPHSTAWTLGRSVDALASLTGAALVLVSRRVPSPSEDRARVLALAAPGTALELLEHGIAGEPWEPAFEGEAQLVTQGLRRAWPDTPLFQHLRAEAFTCTPLRGPDQEVLGVLMGVYTERPDDMDWVEALFQLCANRTAVEVWSHGGDPAPAAASDTPRGLISRSAERYHAYVEGASAAIWCLEADSPLPLDLPAEELFERLLRDGRIVECNDAFAREQGRATAREVAHELVRQLPAFIDGAPGRALEELITSGFQLGRLEAADLDGQEGPRHLAFDLLPILEDGRFLRLWATQLDVTQSAREREELRDSQEHLTSIFESALDGIFVVNDSLEVVDANGAFLAITRADRRQVLGRAVTEFDPGTNPEPLASLLLSAAAVGPSRTRCDLRRPNGGTFPAEISICHRTDRGGRTYGFVRDMSDEVAAAERDRLHRNQITHISRLSTLGEMAAGIAHELNQPLAAIVNYTRGGIRHMDAAGDEDGPLRHALQAAADQAVRAGAIIRRIRSFVQRGEQKIETTTIGAIIDEALALAETRVRRESARLTTDGDQERTVSADPIQVEQVLLNLVGNALDALRPVPEEARTLHITVLPGPEGMTEVQVRDSGPGLDPRGLEDAFAPFVSTKPSGIGLGLPISRSIIEAHGGRLWFERLDDGTSCFRFTLPPPRDTAHSSVIL